MIQLIGDELYQWDTGRIVQIESDSPIHEVHFTTRQMDFAYVVETYNEGENTYCAIPNVILQSSQKIYCYAVKQNSDGEETVSTTVLSVNKRNRPDDYVYTEPERLAFKELEQRIDDMAKTVGDKFTTIEDELSSAVSTKEQAFTDEQKKQARENIGVCSNIEDGNGLHSLQQVKNEDTWVNVNLDVATAIRSGNALGINYGYGSPDGTKVLLSFNFNNPFRSSQTYILSAGSVFCFTNNKSYTLDRDYTFTFNGTEWSMTTDNSITVNSILDFTYYTGNSKTIQVATNLPLDTPCADFLAGNNGCKIDQSKSQYQQVGWIGMSLNSKEILIKVGAYGNTSVMMNGRSQTVGEASYAEGGGNIAYGDASYAGGLCTFAAGFASTTYGIGTTAPGEAQYVLGKYNNSDITSAFIIGNGSEDTPSNAMTVDWDGNAWFSGSISYGNPATIIKPPEPHTVTCYLTDGSVTLTPDTAYLIEGDEITIKITKGSEEIFSATTTAVMCITGNAYDTPYDSIAYTKLLYVTKTLDVSSITSKTQPAYQASISGSFYTAIISWTGSATVTKL